MCTFPKLQLLPSTFWKQSNTAVQGRQEDILPYQLIAVCNEGGMQQYLRDVTKWRSFAEQCQRHSATRPVRPIWSPLSHTQEAALTSIGKPPKKLCELTAPVRWTEQPAEVHMGSIAEDAMGTSGEHRPLAVDAMAGVYTDGSCIKSGGANKLGAAVWLRRDGRDMLMQIAPNGLGPTNTINRAELSAIHFALTLPEVACSFEDLVIYTDSLCSIQMIAKMLYRPDLMRTNMHLELLQVIVRALRRRADAGARTTLQKVWSHSGIHGNDMADAGATDMAKGIITSAVHTETTTNVPYQSVA